MTGPMAFFFALRRELEGLASSVLRRIVSRTKASQHEVAHRYTFWGGSEGPVFERIGWRVVSLLLERVVPEVVLAVRQFLFLKARDCPSLLERIGSLFLL